MLAVTQKKVIQKYRCIGIGSGILLFSSTSPMNYNSLPTKSHPGTSLMSKAIIQNSTVINYITTAFVNCSNDYHVGNIEWCGGTRSDVVLEPKSLELNLPPIIVQIQHTVDQFFMKRVVNYCLKAYKRYKVDPIILIICIDTLHNYVVNL